VGVGVGEVSVRRGGVVEVAAAASRDKTSPRDRAGLVVWLSGTNSANERAAGTRE